MAGMSWIGKSHLRKEDELLLRGAGTFIDDLEPVAGIGYAAVRRSPYPHAVIKSIDVSKVMQMDGVYGCVTGSDLAKIIEPLSVGIKTAARYLPFAVDRARFVGEPLAVVVAKDRYLAEDALELIEVEYQELPAVSSIDRAIAGDAPVLHDGVGSNIIHDQRFTYGDPEGAFADADMVVDYDYEFPRSFSTPLETYGVIAQFNPHPKSYTIWANFQGPFILQPIMARSLGVSGNRLRIITPDFVGGSFGVKQSIYADMVMLAGVSRLIGRPVKWTQDRLENLMASTATTDRKGHVSGAFREDGRLLGLRFRNYAGVGAYIRAPEPASVYRMHAASNGAYDVRNLDVQNILVVTNKCPTGLNRGYGGPQFYLALEGLMDTAARKLDLDPIEIRRLNFIKATQFPYEAAAGALYDIGDYDACADELERISIYEELKKEREEARRDGKLFGIGLAAGVEPSGSNMAYIELANGDTGRKGGGAKAGGIGSTTIVIEPSGSVTCFLESTPNGQGHATVAAQAVAEELGIRPDQIDVVTSMDTSVRAWSIASGNYSNRFSNIVLETVIRCAREVASELKKIAALEFDVEEDQVALGDGYASGPDRERQRIPILKLGASPHWKASEDNPSIYKTVSWSPPQLTGVTEGARVSPALTYGFVMDLAAVAIDPRTGIVDIRKYVSVHDVGRVLNPKIVEGQVYGGFANGIGTAMYEELAYDASAHFLSGTFAEYLCPTAEDIPPLTVGHVTTLSPTNSLGAKGLGDGSAMLTPAALCNAVGDALGGKRVEPLLSLERVWGYANRQDPQQTDSMDAVVPVAPARISADDGKESDFLVPLPGRLHGEGEFELHAATDRVWAAIDDPQVLKTIIPGCESLEGIDEDSYELVIRIGVGAIRGEYQGTIKIRVVKPGSIMLLEIRASGALGYGSSNVAILLVPREERTLLRYRYGGDAGGKVAAVGDRMLNQVVSALIRKLLKNLDVKVALTTDRSFMKLLREKFGLRS